MPDINPNSSLHLPIDIWIINADEIVGDTPTVETIEDIMTNGYSLARMLDDETQVFSETKSPVEVPNLTALGPQLKDVKILRGPAEIQLPLSCWNYTTYAMMQGLDPDTALQDNIDVKFADPMTPDAVATMLNQQETLDTVRFAVLAHVQPPDAVAGDRYILCPKIVADMESVNLDLMSDYYQQTMSFKSVSLNAAELTPWQAILPVIRASIPMYIFNLEVTP